MLAYRKVEGEGKDTGHGAGGPASDKAAVPLRRWEDWERSRLRKIKREERRRRELDRAHPSGYYGDTNLRADAISDYGSDNVSMTSSDDDHWGPQIGGYNENNKAYPPPPTGLHLADAALKSAETLGTSDLEAMLETGFDDRSPPHSSYQSVRTPVGGTFAPRYTLSDTPSAGNGYTPLERATSPGAAPPPVMSPISHDMTLSPNGLSTSISGSKTHMKKRSGGRSRPSKDDYGPLGPLDPGKAL